MYVQYVFWNVRVHYVMCRPHTSQTSALYFLCRKIKDRLTFENFSQPELYQKLSQVCCNIILVSFDTLLSRFWHFVRSLLTIARSLLTSDTDPYLSFLIYVYACVYIYIRAFSHSETCTSSFRMSWKWVLWAKSCLWFREWAKWWYETMCCMEYVMSQYIWMEYVISQWTTQHMCHGICHFSYVIWSMSFLMCYMEYVISHVLYEICHSQEVRVLVSVKFTLWIQDSAHCESLYIFLVLFSFLFLFLDQGRRTWVAGALQKVHDHHGLDDGWGARYRKRQ